MLPLRHAVALGLLHGPTELLPISSSGHTTLVPWLARWPYDKLDPELRKSFEVALHAGTAAALLLRPPWQASRRRHPHSHRQDETPPRKVAAMLGFLSAGILPPTIAGYTLGRGIERRLGTPGTIAAGLLGGSVAMVLAELGAHARMRARTRACVRARGIANRDGIRAAGSESKNSRCAAEANARDGLALGVAQALALMPGVSRSGATLAAARARGFSRLEADRLSWTVGLPVIAGAALLKGGRLARGGGRALEGAPREASLSLAAAMASAFFSTLASARTLDPQRRARLLPACAIYRGALAVLVIRRMRDNTS